jgi:hypothetical protein
LLRRILLRRSRLDQSCSEEEEEEQEEEEEDHDERSSDCQTEAGI